MRSFQLEVYLNMFGGYYSHWKTLKATLTPKGFSITSFLDRALWRLPHCTLSIMPILPILSHFHILWFILNSMNRPKFIVFQKFSYKSLSCVLHKNIFGNIFLIIYTKYDIENCKNILLFGLLYRVWHKSLPRAFWWPG